MNGLILGLYGLYLLYAGVSGKTDQVTAELNKDMPGFIPWALAIVGLIVMAQTEVTAKIVKPFIFLLILNFVLVNFGNLQSELRKLQALTTRGNTQ